MTMNEYQDLAARTINHELDWSEVRNHALFEMCSETGEIHSFFQKQYQGHMIDMEKLAYECGDLLWGLAELCTSLGFTMDDIATMNIEKLKKRYPDGFSAERSVHREEA